MNTLFKFISSLLLIIINYNYFLPSYSNELNGNANDLEISNNLENNQYLLGPGDKLNILLDEELNINIEREILNDGTLNLPYIGPITLNNLSLKEAEAKIEKELSKELIKYDVILNLIKTRNISVLIIGEINQPGIYNTNDRSKNNISLNPTFIDVIRLAGGFSPDANIENIILKRKMSGIDKFKEREINLIKLLKDGDLNQNPYLFDGDVIKIKKAKNITSQEYNQIANSNLSGEIKVNVIGEVNNPGRLSIKPNTPLNQAIFYAGGAKSWRGKTGYVKLIRINPNSSLSSFDIRANLYQNSSNKSNPLLKDGDTIIVRKTLLANSADALKIITGPIADILVIDRFINVLD